MSKPGKSDDNAHQIVRSMVDDIGMIVWEAAPDGRCIYLNAAAQAGMATPGDFNLFSWHEFIHPDDAPIARRTIEAARAKVDEYHLEYRLARSDGSIRWFAESAAPRFSADGNCVSYVGTFVDVSESREARARLTRSETEHRLLTENARDMISHSDANDIYVYASPSHKATLGYEPNELVGTYLYDYIHPDDLKPSTARPAGQHFGLKNIRFRHKKGHWVWLGATTRAIRDPQTGVKLGVVSVAREITAQLEAERELQRREERFRSLTSLSSDWYWELDVELRFTFCSEGIYSRLGVRPEQLIGIKLDAYVKDHTDPGYRACIESITSHQSFRELIFPLDSLAQPGVVRFLRVSGEPIYENGEFRGYRGVSRDVTREVRTAKALERLATRDVLTELPNRALLQTTLKARLLAAHDKAAQAVFFIDLDGFKEVNDSLGHAAGDKLLQETAMRLRLSVRPDDFIARLGGDEFVVLAACRHGDASAVRLAEKLCSALDPSLLIDGHEVKVTASIGISMFPQDADTSEVLLQSADTALYRAKAAGGNTFRFYTPQMGAASKTRMMLIAALRHALERNEFEVYYQPRVAIDTLRITGVEALLRWTNPQLGAISPTEFIPLAEETGLIEDITDWVLSRATAQAQAWTERYKLPLTIAVNLSAYQLRNEKVLSFVARALHHSGLHPAQLELELTESALMHDPELAAGLLKRLKELGLRLSVDDFGTGYSSLAYLCRFPLDSLKLDRSFLKLQYPDEASPWKLAEAVINLAHTLELTVVAEGVETQEHLEFLRTTLCDEIQGSCISDPVPPDQLEQLLQAQSHAASDAWRSASSKA